MKKNIISNNQSWPCIVNQYPFRLKNIVARTKEEALLSIVQDTSFHSPIGQVANCVTIQNVDGNILMLITRVSGSGIYTWPILILFNKEYDKSEYYKNLQFIISHYRFAETHALFLREWFYFYSNTFYKGRLKGLKAFLKTLPLLFVKRGFLDLRNEKFYKEQN